MSMHTIRDLLVHELKDLYNVEQRVMKALPVMVSAATAPLLASALRLHLGQTHSHVFRLEECFALLGERARAVKCTGVDGLLKEGAAMARDNGNRLVRDAALIGAAQRVEHYEIAAYGTCVELADVLGEESVAMLLGLTLEEERATDARLSAIATSTVNPRALLSR